MVEYTDADLDVAFGEGMAEAYWQMGYAVRDGLDMIAEGRSEDAVLMLEREFFPKWRCTAGCQHDYDQLRGSP